MLVFRNPVTPANAAGMLLAILGTSVVLFCDMKMHAGIAMYNRAKLRSAHGEVTFHTPHHKDRSARTCMHPAAPAPRRAHALPLHTSHVAEVKHL